jgi:PQQ-dependent catabolism-associated CXXCW motif protein
MTHRTHAKRGLAFVLPLLICGLAAAADAPPEPPGYRLDDYRAPTPATVAGGRTIDTAEARRLWEGRDAIFIDVMVAPRRPEGLPEGAVWRPRPHLDIPGSIWLPEAGRGALSPELEMWFRAHLATLSGGHPARRLVFYCLANCWMSWNAAKRAASWGYTSVDWYRDGVDAWREAGLPLAPAEPPADLPQ